MSLFNVFRLAWPFPPVYFGKPQAICMRCGTDRLILDLGDKEYLCKGCWDAYVPSYKE